MTFAINLISSVFKEQSVQINGNKHIGVCQPTFVSHIFAVAITSLYKLEGCLLSKKDRSYQNRDIRH
ncbi:TPA: hypothetical protein QCV71_004583 [Bacillus cereus]|nr:hypothetical protein [Bacillus cereus]